VGKSPPEPAWKWAKPNSWRVPRVTPGPGPTPYFAAGVLLGLADFFPFFDFVFFFLLFIDLAAGVLAGEGLAAKTGPDTAPRNKTAKMETNSFFMTYSF
jgi:hypothetical protein